MFNHLASDANSKYRLNVASGYVQDQIEATRWLQFFLGARYDSFDLSALDLNTSMLRNRVDEKISPRAAVLMKPVDNLVDLHGLQHLRICPHPGDQFSAFTPGTFKSSNRKNSRIRKSASKWNIKPKLLFTAAVYELNRTGVPITNPNDPTTSFPDGKEKTRLA